MLKFITGLNYKIIVFCFLITFVVGTLLFLILNLGTEIQINNNPNAQQISLEAGSTGVVYSTVSLVTQIFLLGAFGQIVIVFLQARLPKLFKFPDKLLGSAIAPMICVAVIDIAFSTTNQVTVSTPELLYNLVIILVWLSGITLLGEFIFKLRSK